MPTYQYVSENTETARKVASVQQILKIDPKVLENLKKASVERFPDHFREWLYARPIGLLQQWGADPREIGLNLDFASYL